MLRCRSLGLVVAAVLGSWSSVRAEHYEVFLVAGQSNCDGRGDAGQLKGPLAKWAKPQPDVLIAYSCSAMRGPILTSNGFKPLSVGWSTPPGGKRPKELPGTAFGPEVSFGRAIADKMPGKHVALIKYTEGGTSLARDWDPNAKNKLYAAFTAFTEKSLKELIDGGHTYTIRGIIWHQGESDAKLTAEEYQKRLTEFIARVRADRKLPDLPFGIGEVYDNGQRNTIRTAQKATAASVPNTFFVPVDGIQTSDKGTHFDTPGQIELGQRFAAGIAKALGLDKEKP